MARNHEGEDRLPVLGYQCFKARGNVDINPAMVMSELTPLLTEALRKRAQNP
jgi:hypothetical protein